jgi:glucose-6-phosphate isomerase
MQNKSYTVYTIEHQVDVPAIKMPEVGLIDLGKICAKQSRALIELLTIKGNPCREISLVDLKPENLGALMMLQMLEVVLYGIHIAINPFGQPAVEEMKKMVKSALE